MAAQELRDSGRTEVTVKEVAQVTLWSDDGLTALHEGVSVELGNDGNLPQLFTYEGCQFSLRYADANHRTYWYGEDPKE